jgi:hypothetical protein
VLTIGTGLGNARFTNRKALDEYRGKPAIHTVLACAMGLRRCHGYYNLPCTRLMPAEATSFDSPWRQFDA